MSIQPTGTLIIVPSVTQPIGPVDTSIHTVDNSAAGIDSGILSGEVFNGKGNSFLDPNSILSTVDVFSHSFRSDGLLKNPNSLEIQATTQAAINDIFSRNFIPSVIQVPLLPLPLALPIPDITDNPTAPQLNLATLFFINVIRATTQVGIIPPTALNLGNVASTGNSTLSGSKATASTPLSTGTSPLSSLNTAINTPRKNSSTLSSTALDTSGLLALNQLIPGLFK
jgi:hypothetical protein